MYPERLMKVYSQINQEKIDILASLIAKTILNHKKVFIFGNGGSAATSSHFVTDLIKRGEETKRSTPIYSLNSNTSLISMIANDYGFEEIFSIQLFHLASKDDLIVMLSASGNSRNLIKAALMAKKIGSITVSVTGFDGGNLQNLTNISINLKNSIRDYGIAEDMQSIYCHAVSESYGKSLANA